MLKKAPRDADSVGVMIPVKVVPKTSVITTRKGNKSHRAVSFSRTVYFRIEAWGASPGLRKTMMVTVSTKKKVRMIPGITPPAKSRATETSCQPP